MNNPIVLATKNELPNEVTRVYTLVWAKMYRSPIIIHNVVSIPQHIISDAVLGGSSLTAIAADNLGKNQLLLRAKEIITILEKDMKKQ